ncbi:hypothetical protein CRG98_009169 [Punica granatum]|uniref:Uncharacterized protein n=1 Tax=Punica granatum TaxID=22663 RepID=A0A2I0KPM2_PUNGR|nr:hypothetical protein CRG98_009169 [Punica granatum]
MNLRCRKVNTHGLADPARLQKARERWFGELAVQESKHARVSRPGKFVRGTNENRQDCKRHEGGGSANLRRRKTRQGFKRHERGGSANLRCKKVSSNGLEDPARLQEARARWLGELAVQEMKLARVSDLARLQEARARWLGELAVQESILSRVSRLGKVARSTGEVARRTCGAGKKVSSHGLADPARLQEARARWLGELAVQESILSRVSRPGKVTTGMSVVGCKRHERGGSANLRCKKVNSNGLADPARLHEARARWLGELAVQESKLARVSRLGKVARNTGEVARRTYEAGKKVSSHGLADRARLQRARARRLGELAVQESCRRHERGGSENLRFRKVNTRGLVDPASLQEARTRKVSSHGLADPTRLQGEGVRWLGELAVQESKLARVSRPSKVAGGTSGVVRRTCGAGK